MASLSMLAQTVWHTAFGSLVAATVAHMTFPYYLQWLALLGTTERLSFVISTSVVHALWYFGLNFFFLYADYIGMFAKYKIPRKDYQVPSAEKIRNTILVGLIQQLTAQPLTLYFIYPVFLACGSPGMYAQLPSIQTLTVQFAICQWFNDVFFYVSHRALHHPRLYALFHKQHHSYTGTIGFAAEHATFVEGVVSNHLPTIGGSLFFGFHPLVWLVWLSWRLVSTYEAHSGFCFRVPILGFVIFSPEGTMHHDLHHSVNTGNFGTPFLDWLFGTTIINAAQVSTKAQ